MGIGDIDIDGVNERVACMLILDTSSSMQSRIGELNAGLQTLKQELDKDEVAKYRVEIAIVAFGPVKLLQDFQTSENFNPPTLSAHGDTPTGEAIEYALQLVDQRKQTYKANQTKYWRPWVMLITDGAPNPNDNWRSAAQAVHTGHQKKQFQFYTIGVTGADMGILAEIAPADTPPMMLQGANFKELFKWLSASTGLVTRSGTGQNVVLPSVGGWGQVTVD
jgi:uncharacterized protein YegL